MADEKSKAGIKRQIQLPNREAMKIAGRSLKIRFWRNLITMAGIVLAIAFFTSVLMTQTVEKGILLDGKQQVASDKTKDTRTWLIFISLLVCTVGISNAMLMSVTERFREIGTMKCLGALDWFVVKLFLFEAMFLGLVGSAVGALTGSLAAVLAGMTQYDHVLRLLPWGEAIGVVGVSILVGCGLTVAGAIYPARRAGKMPPADAMRAEM